MTSVAAGPETALTQGEYFGAYPLAAIRESPLNPRTHYDPAALAELAANLRSQGQITPGLARPVPRGEEVVIEGLFGPERWAVVELAAGHRRRRALELAGIPSMALVVRPMDDAAFVEVLSVENLQRDDLHPLEEAQGFRTLMERAGYDIPRLAARVGRAPGYVYDRLKLLQLVPDAQALFLADRFTLGHAILLARLGPSDQERAIESRRSGNGRIGGLFVHEAALLSLEEEEALDAALDADDEAQDPVARTAGLKPVSVRELQGWIDRHVRFRPEEVDLPNLFPETEQALQVATEQELKVVKITREHLVTDEAKDPSERTYGNRAWKRADGQIAEPPDYTAKPGTQQPATCDHAVMGVVVAGPGRGEAFLVCIAKQKCRVHWAKEQRDAAKRAKEGPRTKQPAPLEDWKARQAKEDAERARWDKARPSILEAIATELTTIEVQPAAALVLDYLTSHRKDRAPASLAGTSAEAVLRQAAYLVLASQVSNSWSAAREWPRVLKPFGVDPKKIRDQVAPPPKAERTAKPTGVPKKSTAKSKKKRAGDVARAKAKRKGGAA